MCHERIYLIKQNARTYTYLNFETTTHNISKLSLHNPKLWYSFLVLLISFKVLKAAQKLSICHRSWLKMTSAIYERLNDNNV